MASPALYQVKEKSKEKKRHTKADKKTTTILDETKQYWMTTFFYLKK